MRVSFQRFWVGAVFFYLGRQVGAAPVVHPAASEVAVLSGEAHAVPIVTTASPVGYSAGSTPT